MEETEWQTAWHSIRDILGSKWSLHILRVLNSDSYGFNELKREIDGMTAAMLSRRLKELRCHGLVERTVEETTPPTTTYQLTDAGDRFATLLREMEELVLLNEGTADGTSRACENDSELVCATGDPDELCVTVSGK